MNKTNLLMAVILSLGLLGLGFMLNMGIDKYAQKDRSVCVKGLSEREVPADEVIWPITLKDAGNDLSVLYESMSKSSQKVMSFLKKSGIDEKDITVSAISIYDKEAERYSSDDFQNRYQITKVITVTSNNVDLVRQIISSQEELIKQGVVISNSESWEGNSVRFVFTGLNDLKPDMIEEATKNARNVAEKFASDSKSNLGKIKNANQGQFSITDRDENTPYIKTVRVVTTIDYYLE